MLIYSITGSLQVMTDNGMVVSCNGKGYEILLPGYLTPYYYPKLGENVTVFTQLFIQGNPSTGNMVPVLVGFSDISQREFFERFITVEGIGVKAGLRALTVHPQVVATAIEAGDAKTLTTLPGLGKQRAAQIIAKLKGKMAKYAMETDDSTGQASQDTISSQVKYQANGLFEDCLQLMVQLGYKRSEAETMVKNTLEANTGISTIEEYINIFYKGKLGSEGSV